MTPQWVRVFINKQQQVIIRTLLTSRIRVRYNNQWCPYFTEIDLFLFGEWCLF
jgi:hypothetical protein